MAVVPMQKVNILVHSSQKENALELLQKEGYVEFIEGENQNPEELNTELDKDHHEVEYDLAKVEYAISFLSKYDTSKMSFKQSLEGGLMDISEDEVLETVNQFCYKDVISRVEKIDSEMVDAGNKLKMLEEEKSILLPWKNFNFTLESAKETKFTKMVIGQIDIRDYEMFQNDIVKKTPYAYVKQVSKVDTLCSVIVIYVKELESEIFEVLQDYKFAETQFSERSDTPKKELKAIAAEEKEIEKHLKELEKESIKLTKDLPKLKIVYDYLYWNRDKKVSKKQGVYTKSVYSVVAWMPKEKVEHLTGLLEKECRYVDLAELPMKEDEVPPVALKNKGIMQPFESVTGVYGLPLYSEVDPTPYLSVFFIVFFGMCLSDAGYGITLFLVTFCALMFLNLPEGMRKMMRLLMIGGVFTFIFGVLYGGWFGIEASKAPGFLLDSSGETFVGQVFQPISDPLSILILALVLGIVQVWIGIAVDFTWKIRTKRTKDAFLDSGVWMYFLGAIIAYVLSLIALIPLSSTVAMYLVLAGVALVVLTQGRDQKGIIGKIGIGALSLYNLVGYFSDVLSYARLLALGLATGIMALAFNIVALLMYDMIPYVGWLVMLLVLIGGHVFNLALSALGSFIHSSRLQFVEFFGKFMEGGGVPFRPLQKVCKYLRIQ